MRGDEAHNGAAEEDGAKHGKEGSNAKRGFAGRKIGQDGASACLVHLASRLPARKIALNLWRYQDMGRSSLNTQPSPAKR
jgi:hypothetical protein